MDTPGNSGWVNLGRAKTRTTKAESVAKNVAAKEGENSVQNVDERMGKEKSVSEKPVAGTSKSFMKRGEEEGKEPFPSLSIDASKKIASCWTRTQKSLPSSATPPPVTVGSEHLSMPDTALTTSTNEIDIVSTAMSQPIGLSKTGTGNENKTTVETVKKDVKSKFIVDKTELCDVVESRQKVGDVPKSKQGFNGKQAEFTTNYYPLVKLTDFNLFHYHLECKPDEERTDIRKKMVHIHEPILGSIIFDGQSLYSPRRIAIKFLYSLNPSNQTKTQICLRLVAEISPSDPVFLQVYNIMFRNMMTLLKMEPVGRFYYDPGNKVMIPSRKLEVWPGYITSVRNHEHQLLLNLELNHKVVRSDSVLEYMKSIRNIARGDYKREIAKLLLGTIVITSYNKKTYKIDDIKWDATPKDRFESKNGDKISFADYYKTQYGSIIKDMNQPMLVSMPKKKDYHRGCTQSIFLVPEICQMTGLTDLMRKDFQLMKDLTEYLTMGPEARVKAGNQFIRRWYSTPKIVKELQNWNVELGREPMKCKGRILEMDELIVANQMRPGSRKDRTDTVKVKVKQVRPGDWTNIVKKNGMLSTVDLSKWVLIAPAQSDSIVTQTLLSLRSSARSMNFLISEPLTIHKMIDLTPPSFAATIDNLYTKYKKDVQMFFVILPNANSEIYSAIKKKTYCDLGVACQCVIVKTLMNKNLPTIAARIGIQMNAKLGGVPWSLNIPLKDVMFVGYDVFHSPNRRVSSVGALVASTSHTMARYFTSTFYHHNRSELSTNLCSQMINAIRTYASLNKRLPARIILFRDGVGDGQLSYIYNIELSQIQAAIQTVYEEVPPAKFSFIVVSKRIHTRIFYPGLASNLPTNPPPGTVIDDVITLPERYDFFLVSQQVFGKNTASPTNYNVLYDEQGLNPDKMQRLTLKLCHLYYNYTGTIAVPAPCQFAHKLAYLTGQSLSSEVHQKLQNYLYFL